MRFSLAAAAPAALLVLGMLASSGCQKSQDQAVQHGRDTRILLRRQPPRLRRLQTRPHPRCPTACCTPTSGSATATSRW